MLHSVVWIKLIRPSSLKEPHDFIFIQCPKIQWSHWRDADCRSSSAKVKCRRSKSICEHSHNELEPNIHHNFSDKWVSFTIYHRLYLFSETFSHKRPSKKRRRYCCFAKKRISSKCCFYNKEEKATRLWESVQGTFFFFLVTQRSCPLYFLTTTRRTCHHLK